VIILTGHGTERDEQLARELGAFAYLEKPVDIEKLTQTLREAYRKTKEDREAEKS
jgi:DNA-binding NtrC family response regulator